MRFPAKAEPHLHGRFLAYEDQGPDRATSVTAAITEQYYTNNGDGEYSGHYGHPWSVIRKHPNALPLLGFIQAPFQNAERVPRKGSRLLGRRSPAVVQRYPPAQSAHRFVPSEAGADSGHGTVFRADGSLGPCGWTSCSGAPKWRATWQNTFDVSDRFNFTLTANYTSGYSSTAADSGGVYKDCIQSAINGQLVTYDNGDPVQCSARRPSGWMPMPNTSR